MDNGLSSCIHPSRRCFGSPIDELLLQLHLGGESGQNSTAEVELRDRRHQEARLRALGSTFCTAREAFILRNGYSFICSEAQLPHVQYVTAALCTRCEYVEIAQRLRSFRSGNTFSATRCQNIESLHWRRENERVRVVLQNQPCTKLVALMYRVAT
jgi:hypothetical protein